MITKIIEATNQAAGGINWGKFLVGRFDHEWEYRSRIDLNRRLLPAIGWSSAMIMVFDLQTGEGGLFQPGGLASADLNKHRIWVCPLFEPFLAWLYQQDLTDLRHLPDVVELSDAASTLWRRRHGQGAERPSEAPQSR